MSVPEQWLRSYGLATKSALESMFRQDCPVGYQAIYGKKILPDGTEAEILIGTILLFHGPHFGDIGREIAIGLAKSIGAELVESREHPIEVPVPFEGPEQ